MNAVRATALTVHVEGGKTPVLRALDLEVAEEEIFGLLGPSGCGKSTLLKVLAGVHRRWQGELELLGEQPRPYRRFRGALRREVQMVFQDPFASLHPRHTVGRALLEPLTLMKTRRPKDRMREALEEVGLRAELAARYPSELSGGQRQRIAIARALLSRPRLLLLDEPTSALDMSAQAQVLNLLAAVRAAHRMTLVIVSHDLGVIAHLCDRAAPMQSGRIDRLLPRDRLDRVSVGATDP